MRFTTPGSAGLALHRSPPILAYQAPRRYTFHGYRISRVHAYWEDDFPHSRAKKLSFFVLNLGLLTSCYFSSAKQQVTKLKSSRILGIVGI